MKLRIESASWRLDGKTLFHPGDYRVPEDIELELAQRIVAEGAGVFVEEVKQKAAEKQADIDAKRAMNAEDNQTALTIAAAEIQSGEEVAFSTGTGINP